MSPPFCHGKAELSRWTDSDLFAFFDLERAAEGAPKPPRVECHLTPRQLHRLKLFYAGIHDPATVDRLWRERDKT